MTEHKKEGGKEAQFVKEVFASISDRYVLTNHVLSGGMDILWRKWVGRLVASWEPKCILDVASGTGDLALEFQNKMPSAKVVATDFCPEMLEHAKRSGVRLTQVADGMDLPFESASFDLASVAFGLRNMENWHQGLCEMKRVVRPGGRVLIMDFSVPNGFLGVIYGFYLKQVLPRVAGLLTGEADSYHYLAKSIESFPQNEAFIELMEEAGFAQIRQKKLTGGVVSVYYGEKAL